MEAAGSYLKPQLAGGYVGASRWDQLAVPGDDITDLGRGFLPQEKERGRNGAGKRREEEGDVFLFDVTEAEKPICTCK